MPAIMMTADDIAILADAYPNKSEWQRVSYDDGKLIVPDDLHPAISVVDMPTVRKAAIMTYARQRRWAIETGGITVDGIAVATDDRAKVLLRGARSAAEANPGFTTKWDAGDTGLTLTAAQIIAISDAVDAHVAAVFSKFDEMRGGISSGTITTKAQVDAAFA